VEGKALRGCKIGMIHVSVYKVICAGCKIGPLVLQGTYSKIATSTATVKKELSFLTTGRHPTRVGNTQREIERGFVFERERY